MEASLRSFEACEPRRVERVEIEPFDQVRLAGCFLPPACRARPAPVVICISDEESSVDTSLSRLRLRLRGAICRSWLFEETMHQGIVCSGLKPSWRVG